MRAVNHAHTVLSWQENLATEEVPPEWMWALDEPLEEWFDQVTADRTERMKGGQTAERDTVVPLVSNDLARQRRARHAR